MQPFVYDALPGRVVFGNGSVERVPDEVERLGATRVLLIADRSAAERADRLADRLGQMVVARVDDVRVHVPVEHAEAARNRAREVAADAIVTIGGGSATGLGKAVALELPIPILAVPTTYAGSEMTPIWGLTEGARKTTGRDPRVQPRTVIYDPVLTLTLPPSIAGPSGMNALAHCAEALYGPGANPITSLMAEEGIRTLVTGLPGVIAAPEDLDARGAVLVGAYLAGASFGAAGSGLHHKICHVLGGAYDLPHAELHAVILPQALALIAPLEPAAIRRMAAAIGDGDVPGAMFDLDRRLGVPTALSDIGLHREQLDAAATLVADAVATATSRVSRESIQALLADAFDGRRPSSGPTTGRTELKAGVVAPGS